MREILFKGKCAKTSNWVYGCLVNNMFTYSEYSEFKTGTKVCEIITGLYESDNWEEAIQEKNNLVRVIAESVGQFTGLTDKNGTKVFEGDILENTFTIKNYEDDDYHLENRYPSQYETKTCKSDVKFIKGEFRITSGVSFNNCKIIGNIHDNPELLK